jgi:peptidoglycan hydrolase-like protein with peptidoglycan-binding domain
MKKNLIEQLERIHRLNYGKKVISEGFLDDILNLTGIKKTDDPKKADLVGTDVEEFYNTLESIDSPIFQQNLGTMEYQKDVETVQIGLKLLGYELPKFGVDGLFGPETAIAVNKFKSDNKIKEETSSNINEATLEAPIPLMGVTSQYGVKRSTGNHPGVDLKASSGTEIK